jgi:hypothetical protein
MHRPFLIAILLSVFSAATSAHAESPSAESEIRATLNQWTNDFNAGRSDKICSLFSGSLLADVRERSSAILELNAYYCARHSPILITPTRTLSD